MGKHIIMVNSCPLRYQLKGLMACAVLWVGSAYINDMAAAQNVAQSNNSKAPTSPSATNKVTWKAEKTTSTARGVRLEGNASITSPEMSVSAPLIEFDLNGGKSINEIRASKSVNFRMNMTPTGGGTPVSIDVTSNEATATLAKSTLVLTGNVDGQYTIGKGKPNKLRGNQATLTFANQNLNINLEGGPEGVRLELPPEPVTPKPAPPTTQQGAKANPAQLGTVVITAQRATVNAVLKQGNAQPGNTQNEGTARFIGNARAVSTDGPMKFDIAAPEFLLTRVATGTIDTLKTVGRTQFKVDFPPEPVTQDNAPANTEPKGANAAPNRIAVGRPTHLEAEADVLTITRPDNSAVLDGNVKGFYQLPPAEGGTQDLHFTYDRVNLRYDATAGLQVEMLGQPGKPGVIETPGFEFKFGG